MSWRNIPDTEIEVDKPITQPLMQALRDNPIAIAQADAIAPRIHPEAVAAPIVPGNIVRFQDIQTWSTTSGEQTVLSYKFWQPGGVRVTFSQRKTSGSGISRVYVRRNGGNLTSFDTASEAWVFRSVDITLFRGSVLQIVHHNPGVANDVELANPQLRTNGINIWPSIDGRIVL